jgi:hypothetical protein
MNTKLGSAARAGMGRAWRWSHVNEEEKGGSMRITSNLQGWREGREERGR